MDNGAAGPAEEFSLPELKRRSFSGMGSLIKRQIAVRLFSFAANVALARLLAPEVFGAYAIVAFIVQFFSTFGDVGIGAALIQRQGELSRKELSSVFWLQQTIVAAVSCAAFAVAPLAASFYPSLPSYGVWLIRAMAASFMLASLKTVPGILMERRLDFGRIAIVDIAETLVFYSSAIGLALSGFGVWSFISAAILRSAAGAAMIYGMSDWRPGKEFDAGSVKGLLRFGLPYQGNTVIGFIKDAVTPVFIGAYCGAQSVGYVNWAKSLALAPLMFSEAFGRVAFPAFSRIQKDRAMLGRAVERSIRMMTLLLFPVTALMLSLGPEIVRVVFTPKWLPALPAYYFYCTSTLVAGIVLPMYSAILSLGRSGTVLRMMAGLAVLEWGFGVPFVLSFGFNGIAFSQPGIALLFCFVYRRVLAGESVKISLLKNIVVPAAAAGAAGVCAWTVMGRLALSPQALAAAVLSGAAVYIGAVRIMDRKAFQEVRENLVHMVAGGKT